MSVQQHTAPGTAPPPDTHTDTDAHTDTDSVTEVRTAPGKAPRLTIRPARQARRGIRVPRWARRASGPVGVLLVWYVASVTGVLPENVLASPVDVVRQAWDLTVNGELPSAIAASGKRAATGFVIGAVIALSLALAAGLFRLGEDVIDSSMGMFRAIPWVGLIPLFIVWFGIEETPKIALVALGVTYPLYFNIYGGIRSADSQLIEAARMLGLGRLGLIRYVILPSALPGALIGLRYALSTAWLALVFAEQVNASNGIGYLMSNAQQYFRTDVIVLCLAVYAVLGLICDFIVRLLSKRLLSWRASFDGDGA
ncbi:ABC transporter permease [Streptomyces sp. NPDC050509]|uniref:ABC transporter permease n=1 Tax=Streptomyces sp. NPDC050509 TaxID=3365620 RepID=UPI0037A38FE3